LTLSILGLPATVISRIKDGPNITCPWSPELGLFCQRATCEIMAEMGHACCECIFTRPDNGPEYEYPLVGPVVPPGGDTNLIFFMLLSWVAARRRSCNRE